MKTNIELVEYCIAQLGKPYWFGTFGLYPTEALWNNKKAQYPKYYSDARKKKASAYFGAGAKMKVHDCIGLYKGFLWSVDADAEAKYNPKQDLDADSYFKKIPSDKKGIISTIPNVKGLGVWRKGHFGIYIGDGEVIEAMGFDYGVRKTLLSERDFTHWMYLDEITYNESQKPAEAKPEPNTATSEPKKETAPSDDVIYVVKKGDTLSKIASSFNTSVANLVKWNGIENPNLIIIGQKLTIKNVTEQKAPEKKSIIGTVVTNGSSLNIRAGAGTFYNVIGSLKNGSKVEIDSANGDWYKLSNNKGFVFAKYVQI